MSTASEPVAATGITPPASTTRPGLLVRGLAAAGIATVVNVVLLLVATAAGASMIVDGMTIGLPPVVIATLVPLALGVVVAWLLARRWPVTTPILAWAGLALGVLSVIAPLTQAADMTSGLTLAIMHLVAGGSYFAALMSRR